MMDDHKKTNFLNYLLIQQYNIRYDITGKIYLFISKTKKLYNIFI